MFTPYQLGQQAALQSIGLDKVAASRLDKEVLKGLVNYSDVVPHAVGTDAKNILRGAVHTGTQQSPEAVARYRGIQRTRYNNEHLLAEKARAMAPELQTAAQQDQAKLFKGDPNRPARIMINADIYVPETHGQIVRQIGEENLNKILGKESVTVPLPARGPADDTLNMAALMHEKAEREARRKAKRTGKLYPHASHAGVGPIIIEEQVMSGDLEAQLAHRGVRMDTDNALVAKLMRQVGHHPDSPMAADGKQQAALERLLEANAHKLNSGTVFKNIDSQLDHIQRPARYPYIATVPGKAQDIMQELRGTTDQGRRQELKDALKKFKGY